MLLVPPTWVLGDWMLLVWAVVGAAAMFAVYFILALISPSSMGMGDVKLALVIGLLLGWFGLSAWLIGLLAAFIVGGVIAIVALVLAAGDAARVDPVRAVDARGRADRGAARRLRHNETRVVAPLLEDQWLQPRNRCPERGLSNWPASAVI